MKKAPISLSCLVLAVFLAFIICPSASAGTSPAFAMTQIYVSTEATSGGISNGISSGDVVDAAVTEVRLVFNKVVDEASVYVSGNVTMRDSQGNDPGWPLEYYSDFGFRNPGSASLKPGETYTIRVKGGPNGIRDKNGGTLSDDLVATFKTAQGAFEVTGTDVFSRQGPPLVTTTEREVVIPRATSEIRLVWNRLIGSGSLPGAVIIRDSQGRTPNWHASAGTGPVIYINVLATLPKTETYTVTIMGGPGGLKSQYGNTLPQDVTLTFRTEGESLQQTVPLQSALSTSGVRQSELYLIHAAKGPLTISLADWSIQGASQVVLEDPRSPEILVNEQFSVQGKQSATVELPHDGTYTLLVAPNMASHVTITGMDLEVAREMPVLKLPEIKPLETRNEPFTLQPELLNPAEAKSLRITLNKKELVANALKPDGTIDPVVIDPQRLPDGIYQIGAVAEGKSSGNQAITDRSFLVDREASFSDVGSTHWARRYVEVMHHLGILSGRGAARFAPEQPVRRAEFAKMLALILQLTPKNAAPSRFADVPDGWAKPHIDALAEAGLIQGESVGGKSYYFPDRTMSRAEAATMLGRALGIATVDVSTAPVAFKDGADVPSWAKASVVILHEAKWLTGFPDGTFGPSRTLGRDQAAKLLSGLLGLQ